MEEKDEAVEALMDVNGLRYMMTPGVSVATTRILREWDSQRASYSPGEVMQFIIGSGAAFVDPRNSYLKFTLRISGSDATKTTYRYFWGNDPAGRQNALNLFNDYRLTHSSGYEIDRIQAHLAAWTYLRDAYTKSKEWFDTVGSLMRGVQTGPDPVTFGQDGSGGALLFSNPQEATQNFADINSTMGTGGASNKFQVRKPFIPVPLVGGGTDLTVDVIIPLSAISGIWDNDQLSPPYLMAGLNLQMTVASKYTAFTLRTTAADPADIADDWTFSVENPRMCLETITFTDAVVRALSQTSVTNGLEMPFMATHYVSSTAFNSNNSIQINRGLSRANAVIVRNYTADQVASNTGAMKLDSQAANYMPTGANNGFQVKLGSEFMPTRPLDQPMALYHATQTAFGNWRADQMNTVTINDFSGRGPNVTGGVPNPTAVLGAFAMTLEKSSTLAQSGSPISASRDLQITFGSQFPAGNRLVDCFITYVLLVTLFADSALIRN